jgi:uncharacterized alpha-E superfamily protein
VISRVADGCFWFGRYLDRAESTARLLQATRTLVSDADIPVTQCWQPLIIVSGVEQPFRERYGDGALGNGELVQEYLTWSRESLVSLTSSARFARECARGIRDQLSIDVWEEVNELYLWLGQAGTRTLYDESREQFYSTVRKSTQLILGLVRSTMLHEEPMSFLWLGAMLERAGMAARTLDMDHHTLQRQSAHDIVQAALWLTLLRACSGHEAFMKKNQGRVSAEHMVSFLLFEPAFPRSIRYCLQSAQGLLRRIYPEPSAAPAARAALERIETLIAWLEAESRALDLARIHDLLTHVVDETAAICTTVCQAIEGPPRSASPVRAEVVQ